eukprot:scaffold647997_cov43-Prasinocladus_malaysianus.AAC.1
MSDEQSTSYFGSLYNLGASALQYATDTAYSAANSIEISLRLCAVSYVYNGGELDVVDPNAEGGKSVTELDSNDVRPSACHMYSKQIVRILGAENLIA